jgi:hypothetical protein
MKREQHANAFFAACFLVFLFIIMTVTIAKPKETASYYENRLLASAPVYDFVSFTNGDYFGGWEDYLVDHSAGRNTLLKLSTYIDTHVIHRPVVNEVVVTDDMLLGFNEFETVDTGSISKNSREMSDHLAFLNNVILDYGGDFYYVAVPGQYTYFSDKYPNYLNNRDEYTKIELAQFKMDMTERGVALLDMGDVFQSMGNPANMYSEADYHFSYYGAYVTYQTIMNAINANTEQKLTMLTEDDITFEKLDNTYMGSRMRKLCNVWESTEKLVIGYPNQSIPFTRTDNGTLNEPTVYALPPNAWENVTYSIYMGGDNAETVIDTGREELPSILVYGDSFTNPVETLIYYSFGVMRSVDLRSYKDMSLVEYIQRYQPDVVVCIRDYEALLSADGNGNTF